MSKCLTSHSVFVSKTPDSIERKGVFSVPQTGAQFTVSLANGQYARSDGGPITTLYGVCCARAACRFPRLTLQYVLSDDPRAVAARVAEMTASGQRYVCPGCGAGEILQPVETGDTYRCAFCHRIVELANVAGSTLHAAYSAHLRAKSAADFESVPVVKVECYWYAVDLGERCAGQRYHNVGKNRQCTCRHKGNCQAVKAVARYLLAGGERAPDPPHDVWRKLPSTCPICRSAVTAAPHLDTPAHGLGWRCQAGVDHYWLARLKPEIRRLKIEP